jgi:hypothetical protein
MPYASSVRWCGQALSPPEAVTIFGPFYAPQVWPCQSRSAVLVRFSAPPCKHNLPSWSQRNRRAVPRRLGLGIWAMLLKRRRIRGVPCVGINETKRSGAAHAARTAFQISGAVQLLRLTFSQPPSRIRFARRVRRRRVRAPSSASRMKSTTMFR